MNTHHNQAPTPAERMFPTPHIQEAHEPMPVIPEVDAAYLAALNAEQKALKAGADPELLPLYGGAIRMAREARMRTTDSLTGLLNREGLREWFERYKPEKFGIFFGDGDNFGEINKKHGHDVGDRVIGYIGENFANKFRIGDDPVRVEKRAHPEDKDAVGRFKGSGVGRMGGDEFLGIANLTHVKPGDEQKVVDIIKGRLSNFGTYHDPKTGLELPISITAVGMVGHARDNKSLDFYKGQLDQELVPIKAARKAGR